MLNAECLSRTSCQAEHPVLPPKQMPLNPIHPQVYPLGTPMYYSIGQTPPYPGIYAIPNSNAPHSEQASPFALISPTRYSQQSCWAQPQLQPQLQPQQPHLSHPYKQWEYMATPLVSPVPSSGSVPSLSPGVLSPPQGYGCEPLTPTTPTIVNPGTENGPSTFMFKVRPYNELSPGNGVKHFAQLVVEIFSTRSDEAGFPLVDAMITREFNTQRRKHEDSMDTSELEKKDENGYYVCRLCSSEPPRYLHLKSLVRHTSTHFATKPFSCLFCEDRFTRTDVARKHLMSCRALRAYLMRFGPDRAIYIQRRISSAQRCMPGLSNKESTPICIKE